MIQTKTKTKSVCKYSNYFAEYIFRENTTIYSNLFSMGGIPIVESKGSESATTQFQRAAHPAQKVAKHSKRHAFQNKVNSQSTMSLVVTGHLL